MSRALLLVSLLLTGATVLVAMEGQSAVQCVVGSRYEPLGARIDFAAMWCG